MGLWRSVATKFLGEIHWTEPVLFKMRLENAVWRRLAMALAVPVVATAAAIVLSGTAEVAIVVALLSALAGVLLLFFFSDCDHHVTVQLRSDEITCSRFRYYWYYLLTTTTRLPYEKISSCRIIHESSTGHPFSVLEIYTNDDDVEKIGVPKYVDIQALAIFLKGKGVHISYRGAVPFADISQPSYAWLKSMAPRIVFAVVVTSILIFFVAPAIEREKEADAKRNDEAAAEAERPEPAIWKLPRHAVPPGGGESQPGINARHVAPMPEGFGRPRHTPPTPSFPVPPR